VGLFLAWLDEFSSSASRRRGAAGSETERHDLTNPCKSAQLLNDLRWHRIVHGNERHRLTADRASTKVERSDIDPGRPERRPELTDETRRVVIDNVEHVTGEVGLDGNAENIDKARGAVAE
jgi:hypothetical protein